MLMKQMQMKKITLKEVKNDVNGSLNITRVEKSSIQGTDSQDYYEISFDKIGTFALYMNLYEGTVNNLDTDVRVIIKNSLGVEIKTFSTGKLDESNTNIYQEFSIDTVGKYYLYIARWHKNNYLSNIFNYSPV